MATPNLTVLTDDLKRVQAELTGKVRASTPAPTVPLSNTTPPSGQGSGNSQQEGK